MNLNQIKRIRRYTFRGTTTEHKLIKEIASDPDFDIKTLVPMLKKYGTRDEELAFHILRQRAFFNDLLYFKDHVLRHPDLASVLSDKWKGDQVYLRFWLYAIGVNEEVKNREDLERWIEENRAKP